MEQRLKDMSQIMQQGELEARERENSPLDSETIAIAKNKRWTLDDPPVIPSDPLR